MINSIMNNLTASYKVVENFEVKLWTIDPLLWLGINVIAIIGLLGFLFTDHSPISQEEIIK